MNTDEVVAQQVALYGEPLSVRFGRLLQALAIPQSRLAATIGLSAPMLSQLASAQRVKISNPAVLARLLRLEELLRSPGLRAGDAAARDALLQQVAASQPQLTTETRTDERQRTIAVLAGTAGADDLARAAAAVPGTALADLLGAAAAQRAQ